jgi:hypothetical protein
MKTGKRESEQSAKEVSDDVNRQTWQERGRREGLTITCGPEKREM